VSGIVVTGRSVLSGSAAITVSMPRPMIAELFPCNDDRGLCIGVSRGEFNYKRQPKGNIITLHFLPRHPSLEEQFEGEDKKTF
jgi:hypothetical protein